MIFDQISNKAKGRTFQRSTRWRVRSSAARWIRRARPCACAWRTESPTLTLLLIFLSFSYPSKHPFPKDIFRIYVIISKNDPKEILEWPLRPRHRGPRPAVPMDFGAPRRLQDASKMPSFFHRILHGFFDRSWLDFPCQLGSTWPPKSIKIHEKSMPRGLPKLSSFFN